MQEDMREKLNFLVTKSQNEGRSYSEAEMTIFLRFMEQQVKSGSTTNELYKESLQIIRTFLSHHVSEIRKLSDTSGM